MKLGDRVIRMRGDDYGFSGFIKFILRDRELDDQGRKCAPYTLLTVGDAAGNVTIGPESDFRALER